MAPGHVGLVPPRLGGVRGLFCRGGGYRAVSSARAGVNSRVRRKLTAGALSSLRPHPDTEQQQGHESAPGPAGEQQPRQCPRQRRPGSASGLTKEATKARPARTAMAMIRRSPAVSLAATGPLALAGAGLSGDGAGASPGGMSAVTTASSAWVGKGSAGASVFSSPPANSPPPTRSPSSSDGLSFPPRHPLECRAKIYDDHGITFGASCLQIQPGATDDLRYVASQILAGADGRLVLPKQSLNPAPEALFTRARGELRP